MERVLMVDDDRELVAMLAQYLALENFELTGVHDGAAGIDAVLSGQYDLVLLDVMLPGPNGFEVLRRVRGANTNAARVPILMLTARGDAIDRIVGLEVGADDYLPKPFNERELVARMRAILRRRPSTNETHGISSENQNAQNSPSLASAQVLKIGDVELERAARRVRRDSQEIELTAVEFDMLALLLRDAGKVVTREHIGREVLDRKLLPFDRAIDTHMSNLRRKLGPLPSGGERIKTVRGVGYIYTT